MSGQGYSASELNKNQLCLWRYPSMDKVVSLNRYTSRVLHLSQGRGKCWVKKAMEVEPRGGERWRWRIDLGWRGSDLMEVGWVSSFSDVVRPRAQEHVHNQLGIGNSVVASPPSCR
ncbi:hypothetical protein ACE6H2_027360 [Prunus campanulata]